MAAHFTTRYIATNFIDDDKVQLTGIGGTSATRTRFHFCTRIWKRRTLLEKALLVLAATFSLIVLVLVLVLDSVEHAGPEPKVINVQPGAPCLNQTCVHIANSILEAMDLSVDPCEDFYSYSCNGWIKANPTPDDKTPWNTLTKLKQRNLSVVKRLFDQPLENFKSEAEKKAKMYYESCLDANNTLEELGAKPMVALIRKLGGWNVTTSGFDPRNWSLQNVVQLVQNQYNTDALFTYGVGEDAARHILQLDQSGLTLPGRDYYLDKKYSKILDAYLGYMTKVGVLLGGEPNSTKEQMRDVLEFETKLANITTSKVFEVVTVAELSRRAKFLDWRGFFQNAMGVIKREVTPKEEIKVYALDYFRNLSVLIEGYQSSVRGNTTLTNYLVWQTVQAFVGYLSKAFRDAYNNGLRRALLGSVGSEEPQWQICVEDTTKFFGFAVGSIFVRETFDLNSKLQAEEIMDNVRKALKTSLDKVKWMDRSTRKAAIAKVDGISEIIGYADFVHDPKLYEGLEVRSGAYFHNILNAKFYDLKKSLEKINGVVDKTTSMMDAYYAYNNNHCEFPAGILQSPIYDPTFPPSLNYGRIGTIMAHELAYSVDDKGRKFDENGDLNDWWSNTSIRLFGKRTKCFIDQYSKYKVDGAQSLNENIADNGGVKSAYYAYLALMNGKPKPLSLPGVPLNHKQLFFVAFAQIWCSSDRRKGDQVEEVVEGTPPKYRVIGSLSNFKEFSKEFHCGGGSKMNPKEKCEVW